MTSNAIKIQRNVVEAEHKTYFQAVSLSLFFFSAQNIWGVYLLLFSLFRQTSTLTKSRKKFVWNLVHELWLVSMTLWKSHAVETCETQNWRFCLNFCWIKNKNGLFLWCSYYYECIKRHSQNTKLFRLNWMLLQQYVLGNVC